MVGNLLRVAHGDKATVASVRAIERSAEACEEIELGDIKQIEHFFAPELSKKKSSKIKS
jgi:hypothetical protein